MASANVLTILNLFFPQACFDYNDHVLLLHQWASAMILCQRTYCSPLTLIFPQFGVFHRLVALGYVSYISGQIATQC